MIKRAIVKVIVYFDDDEVAEGFFNDADLGEIGHAYTTGPCVGAHEVESIEVVEGEALREGLLAIGNDGEFFTEAA
jgi:hypothetical protein